MQSCTIFNKNCFYFSLFVKMLPNTSISLMSLSAELFVTLKLLMSSFWSLYSSLLYHWLRSRSKKLLWIWNVENRLREYSLTDVTEAMEHLSFSDIHIFALWFICLYNFYCFYISFFWQTIIKQTHHHRRKYFKDLPIWGVFCFSLLLCRKTMNTLLLVRSWVPCTWHEN